MTGTKATNPPLSELSTAMWTSVIGTFVAFLAGVLTMALWQRARGPKAQATAVPSAQLATPPLPTLDTHLVLNTLNRFAIALPDEHLQDGLEALGLYLGAGARDAKSEATNAQPLGTHLEQYWRLTEWLHAKPRAVWQLDCPVSLSPLQRAVVVDHLQTMLQTAEHSSAARLALDVSEAKFSHQGVALTATLRLEGVGPRPPKASSQATWRQNDNTYIASSQVISIAMPSH